MCLAISVGILVQGGNALHDRTVESFEGKRRADFRRDHEQNAKVEAKEEIDS